MNYYTILEISCIIPTFFLSVVFLFVGSVRLQVTYGALCSGRSVIRKAGLPKLLLEVKFVCLDQISKESVPARYIAGFYSVVEHLF